MEILAAAAFPEMTTSSDYTESDGWDSLENLVIGLYSEAFASVVSLVNKAISSSTHTIASILLFDSPGFQNPASCGQQAGATIHDLCHNYLHERLQLLFHHMTIVVPLDRYAQESVEVDTEGFQENNSAPLVSLFDKVPQGHMIRTSQRDLKEIDRKGLFWLLDEESLYPNSNDDTFLDRLFSHYGDREHSHLLRRAAGSRQFIIQHLQGTAPVYYHVQGWLKSSRQNSKTNSAASLLQDSNKEAVSKLFIRAVGGRNAGIFCSSLTGMEGTQTLRRVSSIRRSFTTSAGDKRSSIMVQVKFTIDGIIDTLRRTGIHFVQCLLLQHNEKSSVSSGILSLNSNDLVNIPLLRSQIRGSQILEAARLHRLGFPESVPATEFLRRFSLLGENVKDLSVEHILSTNEIDPMSYRIGPSQVCFFFLFNYFN